MNKDKFVTVTRLAKDYAGCSPQYIHQLLKEKRIKANFFLGGSYLFTKANAKKIHDRFFDYVPLNKTLTK